MGLADRVDADDERKRLLVIHRHAAERLSNELCRKGRIRVAARPLRVYVDQAHVIGAHRPLDLLVAGVALIARPAAAKPAAFWAPEDLVGFPAVLAPKAEAERLEAHRFISTVAGEDDQIGPGEDRKSTRLNSSHSSISYAAFCLKKKKTLDPRLHQHHAR